VACLEERPEEGLPAQHPVGEEVEARLLLDADELAEVAPDLLVDRLGARPAAVEVARRLDERLRAGVDAWCECLQTALLVLPEERGRRGPGLFRRLLTRSPSC